MRKSELIQVEGTKKGRGKQRITSLEVVKKKVLHPITRGGTYI